MIRKLKIPDMVILPASKYIKSEDLLEVLGNPSRQLVHDWKCRLNFPNHFEFIDNCNRSSYYRNTDIENWLLNKGIIVFIKTVKIVNEPVTLQNYNFVKFILFDMVIEHPMSAGICRQFFKRKVLEFVQTGNKWEYETYENIRKTLIEANFPETALDVLIDAWIEYRERLI